MPLVKLDIPAGVYSHGTPLDSKGRWIDSNLVRWVNNSPQPVGGWDIRIDSISGQIIEGGEFTTAAPWTIVNGVTITTTGYGRAEFTSVPAISSLSQNTGYTFDGTETFIATVTVLIISSGSLTVRLGSETLGTITASGTYSYETAPTSGTDFVIESAAKTVATVGAVTAQKKMTSRGAHSWLSNNNSPYLSVGSFDSIFIMDGNGTTYDITPAALNTGIAEAVENLGYGGGNYSAATYGTPRNRDYSIAAATNWTLDNWGENLVGVSDGDNTIYELVMDDGDGGGFVNEQATNMTVVSNAPICKSIIVTAERFLFALAAAGNPRLIQWSDRENNSLWAPAVTNEAGDLELQTTGSIVCAERVRGRTLILTTDDAWVAVYQGPPIVYGFQKIGNSCGVAGRNLSASVGPTAFWMGESDFFFYDGSIARVLPCEVHDKVFTEMNRDRISHAFCVANQQFSEVWWFYPGSGSSENDRYVTYDYNENHWTIGSISRSAGVDSGAFVEPLWLSPNGAVYRHETSYSHDGNRPYLESGPINIDDGENVVRVTEMIPEEETKGQMEVSFKTRFYPNGTEYTYGPYDPSTPTSVRFTGRQFRMTITADDGANWRFGDVRLRIKGGGQR